jgi:hypothetical protein
MRLVTERAAMPIKTASMPALYRLFFCRLLYLSTLTPQKAQYMSSGCSNPHFGQIILQDLLEIAQR